MKIKSELFHVKKDYYDLLLENQNILKENKEYL